MLFRKKQAAAAAEEKPIGASTGPVVASKDSSTYEETAGTSTPAEPVIAHDGPPRNVSGAKWVVVVMAILSSTFLFALDNTVVADVQPQIVLQFDAVGQLAWLSVAFIMAGVSTNLLYGQLYSLLPSKPLYIGSTVLFEVGSALCGAAPSMPALIVGRALAGLGGIGIYLGVMALIAHTTSLQERPLYVALVGLTWGVGTILGPVVGGLFAESSATWRWAFYINLVVFALALPVYLFLLPSPDPYADPSTPILTRLRHVDWVGAPLMVGAICSLTMGINFGGVVYDWNSGQEIALFVVAGVLFIVFGVQQWKCIGVRIEDRIFPVQFLRDRTVLLLFLATAAGGTCIFLPTFFIPLYFQFTRGDDAVQAAVRLLPFIVTLVTATMINGGTLTKYGLYWPWYTVGGLLTVSGAALMFADVSLTTSTSHIYGYSALLGIGTGFFGQCGFAVAQASVAVELAHTAAAFIALGQTGGITAGLAIANAVFLNDAEDRLADILVGVPKDVIQTAIAGVSDDIFGSLAPSVQRQILDAVVESISTTYALMIAAGAFVVVLSLLMKKERLFMVAPAVGA